MLAMPILAERVFCFQEICFVCFIEVCVVFCNKLVPLDTAPRTAGVVSALERQQVACNVGMWTYEMVEMQRLLLQKSEKMKFVGTAGVLPG